MGFNYLEDSRDTFNGNIGFLLKRSRFLNSEVLLSFMIAIELRSILLGAIFSFVQ